jgi:predicted metalloprotease with PDZ domain
LGINVKTENGREMIKSVAANSPAQLAGVDPGDELLAIDGFKVTAEKLAERLKSYQAGQQIELTVFHADRLMTVAIVLANPQPQQYQLQALPTTVDRQRQLFKGWVGH